MPESQPDWVSVARLVLLSRKLDRLEVEELTPPGQSQLSVLSRWT